jgi:hypothetical protein
MLAADPGSGEHPRSEDVIRLLYDSARASADVRRAVAVAADVLVDGADAVSVEAEHREGIALVIVVPYSRSRFRKTVTFGEMTGGTGQPRVWRSA